MYDWNSVKRSILSSEDFDFVLKFSLGVSDSYHLPRRPYQMIAKSLAFRACQHDRSKLQTWFQSLPFRKSHVPAYLGFRGKESKDWVHYIAQIVLFRLEACAVSQQVPFVVVDDQSKSKSIFVLRLLMDSVESQKSRGDYGYQCKKRYLMLRVKEQIDRKTQRRGNHMVRQAMNFDEHGSLQVGHK